MSHLIEFTAKGLYCRQADVFIDPWRPVPRALITHAHSDHARKGHKNYLCHADSMPLLRHRLSANISVQSVAYGESLTINGVKIVFYPAGHIIGSAQILLESKEERWVVSGDYNLESDGFTPAFEPVTCDYFVTESTFGLPVFQWQPQQLVFEEINKWWNDNADNHRPSIISAYSLGKAQRIIQNIDSSIGPVLSHPAVAGINNTLRQSGIDVRPDISLDDFNPGDHGRALILCPPGAMDSRRIKGIKHRSEAFASGWMMLRGARRRRGVGKGFVLSDHSDWNALNRAVDLTGAHTVYVTHGYTDVFAKYLSERGLKASVVKTRFEGEASEDKKKES